MGDAGKHQATIGRAQGVLMERLGIRADSALQYLRSVATDSNRTLEDVAAEIIQNVRAGND